MAHPGGAIIIPFIGLIPGGMAPGKKLSFHGMVPPTCGRFSINLQCGPNVNPRDDLALHMNFRYDAQVPYVVRNSLQMQQWGVEEGHGYLSFARGQTFEIRIDAEHDHFKIYFNGHHFSDFKYRVPLQRVTFVTIDGEVIMHSVKVDGYDIAPHLFQQPMIGFQTIGMPPPSGHPGGYPAPMYPTHPVHPAPPHSSAIPVAAGVAAGMAVGATMTHPGHYPMDKHAKKAMKKQKKAMKKAMKHNKHSHHGMHGYPSHHHHHHSGRSSSSSSSSSSSEEE